MSIRDFRRLSLLKLLVPVAALATGAGEQAVDMIALGALAARAVERAIVRGVTEARGLAGVPSAGERAV